MAWLPGRSLPGPSATRRRLGDDGAERRVHAGLHAARAPRRGVSLASARTALSPATMGGGRCVGNGGVSVTGGTDSTTLLESAASTVPAPASWVWGLLHSAHIGRLTQSGTLSGG